jgi:lipoprotein-anchoring transpeptidase ErfK/SrfK
MRPLLLAATILLAGPAVANASLSLHVNLEERALHVYENQELISTYPISPGKDDNPTPTGQFTIRKVVWNPAWVPPNERWARGKSAKPPGHPENPMKRVKMFFKEPDYYIHGTGDVDSLGTPASHGCVRMDPDDVTELAQLVMAHGGEPRPLPWYRRIFRSRTTKTVLLEKPVPVRIE